ncbi:MAG: DUF3048 domain-containing protein [Clostridia bacterium]|nr:DUF3048 domain-containing protein [Clostridia bacterium]
MKKITALILALSFVVLCTSCKKEVETVNPVVDDLPKQTASDFYVRMTESKSRPVAVMIDNDSEAARPQTGLEDAFAVYEIKVEGIASRMMALFLDADTKKVGPVRSSRHYFLDYALEHDAIYAHCGYSPQAANDITALGVDNLNEFNSNNGATFFRDRSKYAPHNLYASVPELLSYASGRGYESETGKDRVFEYNENDEEIDGNEVTEISLPYHSSYVVSYKYNAEEKVYERFVNGQPHISESNEKVLTAKNILAYNVVNYSIDTVGRQNLENLGSGTGYYLSNGKVLPITWSKSSRSGKTEYKTEDGENLILNPGNVYVHIVPASEKITIK